MLRTISKQQIYDEKCMCQKAESLVFNHLSVCYFVITLCMAVPVISNNLGEFLTVKFALHVEHILRGTNFFKFILAEF